VLSPPTPGACSVREGPGHKDRGSVKTAAARGEAGQDRVDLADDLIVPSGTRRPPGWRSSHDLLVAMVVPAQPWPAHRMLASISLTTRRWTSCWAPLSSPSGNPLEPPPNWLLIIM
jgi:hypothetical protein